MSDETKTADEAPPTEAQIEAFRLLREARAEVARLRAEVARLRAELAAREVDAEQQKAWDDRGWSLTP